MRINSGLNIISIPKQTSCLLNISISSMPNNNSGYIGLSGSSFVGFKFNSGVVADSNDNFIYSVGYNDSINLSSYLYTGEFICLSNDEILSRNITTNMSGYQYLVISSNSSFDANLILSGESPVLNAIIINQFSGSGVNTLTGYINNSNLDTNFQITGLEVLSPTSYYVDSFDSGILSNSGQFKIKNYYTGLPYDRDDIVLNANTNFGNFNFTLNHNPTNEFDKFSFLNIGPFISTPIEVGSYKTFTLDSRFNYPIENKQISLSFLVLSGGQPMSYYDYYDVSGSGFLSGNITGSGNVSGIMTGFLSGTGFIEVKEASKIFTGILSGTNTGSLTGSIGFTQIVLDSQVVGHSGAATSGSLGIVTGGIKQSTLSGKLSYIHLYDYLSGVTLGTDTATIDGTITGDRTIPAGLISYDLYYAIGLGAPIQNLSQNNQLSCNLLQSTINPNANDDFIIDWVDNYSGAESSSFWYTGKISGFFTGGIDNGIYFKNSITGDWLLTLTSDGLDNNFDIYNPDFFKFTIVNPDISWSLDNFYKYYEFTGAVNKITGIDSSNNDVVKRSFTFNSTATGTQSGDLLFNFSLDSEHGSEFTGCYFHSYFISGQSGSNFYSPTSNLNSNGDFFIGPLNLSGITYRVNRFGVTSVDAYVYTGKVPNLFTGGDISGTHIFSLKSYGLSEINSNQLNINKLNCYLKQPTQIPNYSSLFSGFVNPITGEEVVNQLYYRDITTGVFVEPSLLSPTDFFNIKTGKTELTMVDFNYNNYFNSTGFINSGSFAIAKPIQFNRSFIQVHNTKTGLSGYNILKIIANDGVSGVEYLVTGRTDNETN